MLNINVPGDLRYDTMTSQGVRESELFYRSLYQITNYYNLWCWAWYWAGGLFGPDYMLPCCLANSV